MVSLVPLYTKSVLPDEPGLVKRPIPESQFEVYTKLLNNEANYYNALETIRRFVLGQGMRVSKKKGEFKISAKVQNLLDTEWMVTLAEIKRCLSVFGVCIVDKNKNNVPIVRRFLDFRCTQLEWRDGSIAWHVVWKPLNGNANSFDVMGNTAMPRVFGALPPNSAEEDVLKTGFVLVRNHIDVDGSLRGDARRLLATAQVFFCVTLSLSLFQSLTHTLSVSTAPKLCDRMHLQSLGSPSCPCSHDAAAQERRSPTGA